jgi:tape measure domain-containing protein
MAFTVDIRGNATHLEKTLRSVKGSIANIGSATATGVAGLTAMGAAGAAGLGALVVSSSNAAASVEDLTLQFEVLTGSAKIAKDLIKTFREEEKKSPLNLQDYAEGAKLMLGFGVAIKDVTPLLQMIGDISLGNSERFGRLSVAFAQIAAKGKLMGQELNQLAESGFNPLQIIAEKTGRSYSDLFKDMEAGKITIGVVAQALKVATSEGGRFYKAIEKGSTTTNAKINQTKAAVTQLQVAFGTGFNEGLKDALDASNNYLPQLESKFAATGEFLGAAITESLQGNTDKFAMIGETVGTVFLAGLQASLIAGLDNLGELLGKGLAYGAENLSGVSMLDPDRAKRIGEGIREFTRGGTNFREQFTGAMETTGANAALEKVNIESQVEKGIKTGITAEMSDAVKAGILEAWAKQPSATSARFSN